MLSLEETIIQCPYCGESVQVLLDTLAGTQEYYEDCPVCCAPIFFVITVSDEQFRRIEVKREDE
ncbi:MAG: CPXCG motif-containing cysteine-rich protein [Gammaproteobacteria bacterium]